MAGLVSRIAQSAGLWAAGDASCQVLVPQLTDTPPEPYDAMRTAKQAAFGGAFMATVGHGFYGGIEKLLPGAAISSAVGKVALDQFVFAPVMLTSLFYTMARLDGHSHGASRARPAPEARCGRAPPPPLSPALAAAQTPARSA